MFTIRKKYRIEYAHQLKSAFSEACWKTIHGHSGVVELFFGSDALDEDNMVIDFGKISSLIKQEVMKLDHALVIPESLPLEYISCLLKYNEKLILVPYNPTAEEFAKNLYKNIKQLIQLRLGPENCNFTISKVRFHETESGYAEYSE